MTTLFECDWCGARFDSREQVASVDVTIGAKNETLHACAECVPGWVAQYFPDERIPIDD